MTALHAVVRSLEASGVPHALIGAAAMAAHGIARSTFDFDLLTTDPRVLASDLWADLAGADVEIRHGDRDDPLAGVVRLRLPGERDVDLVVGRARWQQDAIARAGRLTIGDVTLPVVDAADLILLKLYAGGTQDAWDIEQLLAAGARDRLTREVEQRLPVLPAACRALWQRIHG